MGSAKFCRRNPAAKQDLMHEKPKPELFWPLVVSGGSSPKNLGVLCSHPFSYHSLSSVIKISLLSSPTEWMLAREPLLQCQILKLFTATSKSIAIH